MLYGIGYWPPLLQTNYKKTIIGFWGHILLQGSHLRHSLVIGSYSVPKFHIMTIIHLGYWDPGYSVPEFLIKTTIGCSRFFPGNSTGTIIGMWGKAFFVRDRQDNNFPANLQDIPKKQFVWDQRHVFFPRHSDLQPSRK